MKKILYICSLFLASNAAFCQTIENESHSTTGYIRSDGTIENSSHSTSGYIRSDG